MNIFLSTNGATDIGLYTLDAKEIFPIEYNKISVIKKDVFILAKNKSYSIVDKANNFVLHDCFYCEEASELGIILVGKGNGLGLLGSDLSKKTDYIYDRIGDYDRFRGGIVSGGYPQEPYRGFLEYYGNAIPVYQDGYKDLIIVDKNNNLLFFSNSESEKMLVNCPETNVCCNDCTENDTLEDEKIEQVIKIFEQMLPKITEDKNVFSRVWFRREYEASTLVDKTLYTDDLESFAEIIKKYPKEKIKRCQLEHEVTLGYILPDKTKKIGVERIVVDIGQKKYKIRYVATVKHPVFVESYNKLCEIFKKDEIINEDGIRNE